MREEGCGRTGGAGPVGAQGSMLMQRSSSQLLQRGDLGAQGPRPGPAEQQPAWCPWGRALAPRAPSLLLSLVRLQEPCACPALPPAGNTALEKLLTFLAPRFSHVLQTAPRSAGEGDAAMR